MNGSKLVIIIQMANRHQTEIFARKYISVTYFPELSDVIFMQYKFKTGQSWRGWHILYLTLGRTQNTHILSILVDTYSPMRTLIYIYVCAERSFVMICSISKHTINIYANFQPTVEPKAEGFLPTRIEKSNQFSFGRYVSMCENMQMVE